MKLFSLIKIAIMHVYVGYIYGAEYNKNEYLNIVLRKK